MSLTDAVGNILNLNNPPRRIVSLFPSQTHLLAELGLEKEVVGITRFCKFPAHWKKEKKIIGGTKDVHPDRVAALKPDLILANKEENTKEMVEQLQKIAPVYVSEVSTWEDNTSFVDRVGRLTGKEEKAQEIINRLKNKRSEFELKNRSKKYTALYFIWKNPWMTAGRKTFIDTMLDLAGFENLSVRERYPAWEVDDLKKIQPQIVILPDEPYPFKPEKHLNEIKEIFPQARLLFVKGEPFTWFGAYPAYSFDYFNNLHNSLKNAQ